MRPIKFRAWDKKKKHWRNDGEFWYRHGKWIYFIHHYDIENEFLAVPERIEMLEFTGLHDKNKVEIYEGDIVRYNYHLKESDTNFINEVIYDIRTLEVGDGSARHIGFILRGKDEGEFWYCDFPDLKDFEIIGNIHQNPELLKE